MTAQRQRDGQGFSQERSSGPKEYKFVDYCRRVDVIYDHLVHGMTYFQITQKYAMKYNTVRMIINNYKTTSRVNVKKKQPVS